MNGSSRVRSHAALREAIDAAPPRALAIYGIGVVARDLLDEFADLPIVGLLDKDPANLGRTLYGRPVIAADDCQRRGVDLIVIAASDIYWQTIAERIGPMCIAHGIRILCPDGSSPAQAPPSAALTLPLRSTLEVLIGKHEVISFDLFDTLVLRAASRPDDILEAAVAHTAASGDLLGLRKEAEARCTERFGRYAFPLARIYEVLPAELAVAPDLAAQLQAAETALEADLCAPCPTLTGIYDACREAGKSVAIVSDTHLPLSVIEAILGRCGLSAPDCLLLSAEAGCAKASGELYERLKAAFPGRPILHIGDNAASDGQRARERGLTAFTLAAPAERLAASPLGALQRDALTSADGVLLGLVAGRLLGAPLAEAPEPLPLRIDSLRQFGFCIFGPLLTTWFGWLFRRLLERPADRVLFLAREGYVLTPLYERLRAHCGLQAALPPATYFATSRRMACVAALRTPAEVRELLADDYSGSSEGLLRLRFGLVANAAPTADHLTHSDPAAAALVERMMPAILSNAAEERAAYQAYIDGLGIRPADRLAIADLGIKGTIQHALQRMLGKSLDGHYITGRFGSANPFGMTGNTAALFPFREEGPVSEVYRHHILCESVLVAPEGMYIRALPEGGFINAPQRRNQELFQAKAEIHAGIGEFVDSWLRTGIPPHQAHFSTTLVDRLFGLVPNGQIGLSPDLKSVFFVDEGFRAESEKPIWD